MRDYLSKGTTDFLKAQFDYGFQSGPIASWCVFCVKLRSEYLIIYKGCSMD